MQLSNNIDKLPVVIATEVAQSGLDGPHQELVEPRLGKSALAEIQLLIK